MPENNKKTRLGPAAEHVVDAHRHQVDADGMVQASKLRHFQLRADAIGARNEDRVFVPPGK
jgi:hypothetical protein